MSLENGRSAGARALGALRAQRLIDLVGLKLLPAGVGAAIALSHCPERGDAALVLVSMLGAGQLLEGSRFPLQLLPAARIALALSAPPLGAAGALLITLLAGHPIGAGALVPSVMGAWLVIALGAWMKTRLEDAVKIRVAVLGTLEQGAPALAHDLEAELIAGRVRSYEVAGWTTPTGSAPAGTQPSWLGSLDDPRTIVLENELDLILCGPGASPPELAASGGIWGRVLSACHGLPLRMMSVSQFYEDLLGHVPIGTIDASWYQDLIHPRFRGASGASKRVFDLVLGSLIGMLALPVMAVAGIAIKLGDGGPVLYRQRRLGERGEAFEILKLRTMKTDAEGDGRPRWASPADDRVTPVGRVLRRGHLDELPQLWNVLRGEMTLVGPRPECPEIVAALEEQFVHYTRRHLVKPGIAGWAQARCGYAGSERGSAWKLCHDLYYLKHRSLLGDLIITFETAFVTFRNAHRALRVPSDRFILGEQPHA
jgi:lipopolysaccharide/colanic/teichoic acid biosynthesis glycosyltransferase